MKKKVLLSAFLTIALCFSLITGATFALFTSESVVNIAINSGKVEMVANVLNIETWSLENNKEEPGKTDGTFSLGGSASFSNSVLTLDKIVPGDKVSFTVEGTNNSNVTVLYRVKVECLEGEQLMSGLVTTINDNEYKGLSKYYSNWELLNVNTNMDELVVSIELPEEAGNEYQNLNTKVSVTVEAIQGNATVTGKEEVYLFVKNIDEIKQLLKNNKNVVLNEDVVGAATKGGYSKAGLVVSGNTVDGNNNKLTITNAGSTWDCGVYISGGTLKNIKISGAFRGILTAGCSSDIILDNVFIDNVCYTFSSDGSNADYSVIVTNSTFNGWTSYTDGYKSVSFTNCNFGKGTGGYQYAFLRPYSPTTFTNCNFEENYQFDASKTTSTFVNCYCNGTLITQANIASLLGDSASGVVVLND